MLPNNPESWTKFPLGQTVATRGALDSLTHDDIQAALIRHGKGDWGEMDPEDIASNNEALESGFRLFSAYRSSSGVKFWIITEADRSVTTVLLPSEY